MSHDRDREASGNASLGQSQFLRVMTRDEAMAAFEAALKPQPKRRETIPLDRLAGRVLAEDVHAACDAPPFDRSVVDGFAVQAGDIAEASTGVPAVLRLNDEVIACGHEPQIAVMAGTATPIATGGPVPRGADAVLMIERTRVEQGRLLVTAAVAPGQNISFAGSDIARGQTLLHKGTQITAREIGMLAAVGCGEASVWARPRIAVLSTGDELVQPGNTLGPAQIYDSNGPIVAAAIEEHGCEAVRYGAFADNEAALDAALRRAHAECDGVILSGGTSKGAGDLTHLIVARLGAPGIITHGVALKPGKPLCLAVCDGKPVVVLPGFPTSAMFTFHDIVAPSLRAMAGLARAKEATLLARMPMRIASELGRTEFVMVALARDGAGYVAHPVGKGSGAVTAFAQADGFVAVDALADEVTAGTEMEVRLFSPHVAMPDLVIIGSHCVGLDLVVSRLAAQGLTSRILAVGSLGGLAALRRGECDLAPIHLLDTASGAYNRSFLSAGMVLIPGWRRLQGVVFRRGDTRFEGRALADAIAAVLADRDAIMVNRNQGAGTRTLIEGLLGGARPAGYWNQPRSHNAVAASVAQGRADWGVTIRPVADALGLGFIPLADESYDFAAHEEAMASGKLAPFVQALADAAPALRQAGFEPAL